MLCLSVQFDLSIFPLSVFVFSLFNERKTARVFVLDSWYARNDVFNPWWGKRSSIEVEPSLYANVSTYKVKCRS